MKTKNQFASSQIEILSKNLEYRMFNISHNWSEDCALRGSSDIWNEINQMKVATVWAKAFEIITGTTAASLLYHIEALKHIAEQCCAADAEDLNMFRRNGNETLDGIRNTLIKAKAPIVSTRIS